MNAAIADAIIQAAQDAVFGTCDWSVPLERLAEAYHASSVAIVMDGKFRPWASSVRTDPAAQRSFFEYYGAISPIAADMRNAKRPAGAITTDRHAISRSELEKTEFYADWARKYDMGNFLALIVDP